MANLSNLNMSNVSIPPLLKYKIVFVGDQAVGKSSIINRFIYDMFETQQHKPTIGIDFISHNIFLQEKTIRLQLWDTAGQERFRSLIPSYIRDCSVSIIVYSVANRTSFSNARGWVEDIKNQRGQEVILAFLANKCDLQRREVTQQQGSQLARQFNGLFYEVSAKDGTNIQQFFKQVACLLPDINDGEKEKVKSEAVQKFRKHVESNQQGINNMQPLEKTKLVNKEKQKTHKKNCC